MSWLSKYFFTLGIAAVICAPLFAEPLNPTNYTNRTRVVSIEQEIRNPIMLPLQVLVIPLEYARGYIIEDFISDGFRQRLVGALRREERRLGDSARLRLTSEGGEDWLHLPQHGIQTLIDYDNAVVENKITRVTLDKLRSGEAELQRYLFDIPKTVRLAPADLASAGHIHLDMDTFFKNDPKLFLNFVIDFVNHPGLSAGAWSYDPFDAKIPLFSAEQREGFKQVLADFDAGKLKTIPEIQARLGKLGLHKISGSMDKSALNAQSKFNTVELRGIRGYRSASQMTDYVMMLNIRMDYLEKRTAAEGRIPYHDAGPVISLAQVAAQAWSYVTEAGGDWEHFRKLLPPSIRRQKIDPDLAFRKNPNDRMSRGMHCRLFFIDVVGILR